MQMGLLNEEMGLRDMDWKDWVFGARISMLFLLAYYIFFASNPSLLCTDAIRLVVGYPIVQGTNRPWNQWFSVSPFFHFGIAICGRMEDGVVRRSFLHTWARANERARGVCM